VSFRVAAQPGRAGVTRVTRRVAAALAATSLAVLASAGERPGASSRVPHPVKVPPAAPRATDYIRYDTGFNAGFAPDFGNRAVGNMFLDTKVFPFTTGMLTMVTLFPQRSGIQSFTAWHLPNSMGTAQVLPPGFQQANLMAGQFNQVTLTQPITTPWNFLVTFIGVYNGPDGLVGLDSMSYLNLGYHAVQGDYMAPNLVNVTPIPNRNAMLRIAGTLLFIPVELMTFEIQD
jgi:hypothetical protein